MVSSRKAVSSTARSAGRMSPTSRVAFRREIPTPHLCTSRYGRFLVPSFQPSELMPPLQVPGLYWLVGIVISIVATMVMAKTEFSVNPGCVRSFWRPSRHR